MFGRRRLVLLVAAPVLLLLFGVFYVMGIAWTPGGNAPRGVLHGKDCPIASARTTIEGPQDRPAEDADNYEPGRDWSLLDDDPDSLARAFSGYGAERYLKAQLPWRVRFRMEWDSEGSLVAAYGSRADICMLARVVAHIRAD